MPIKTEYRLCRVSSRAAALIDKLQEILNKKEHKINGSRDVSITSLYTYPFEKAAIPGVQQEPIIVDLLKKTYDVKNAYGNALSDEEAGLLAKEIIRELHG